MVAAGQHILQQRKVDMLKAARSTVSQPVVRKSFGLREEPPQKEEKSSLTFYLL